MNFHLTLSL
jgi:hypothetical protein